MGRRAAAPFHGYQSQPWRVEKNRRPQKAHRPLPAWYYRIASLEYTRGRDPYPEDFDEDLSELEESDEPDEKECECDLEAEDKESERSYDGSDADNYYELKETRKERKRELLEQREGYEEEKEARIEYAKEKEEEVNAAYKSFKKARRRAKKKDKTIPLDSIAGQTFKLFSSDYAKFWNPHLLDGTKYVEFYHPGDQGGFDFSQSAGKQVVTEERPVDGHVYFDAETGCSFGPFPLPTRARRKDVKIKGDGKYDLSFNFFGNGYLNLRVPRDLLKDTLVSPSTAPQIFEFVGILRDYEKERKERAEAREKATKNRPPSPPSPRESYFDMNHFMGSWAQSRL
ncbi:hypothetical protein B0J14DRAFT_603019 [Halenospora varia]|nr:hypothetical protein B0J14DRAFT_603019 [Halenospora varia]